MKASDVGSSSVLMAFGGFTVWRSLLLFIGSARAPGPGFFPFCLGLLLIGLALIIFVQGIAKEPGIPEAGLTVRKVIIALVALYAYALALDPLGYLLSTFLLVFFLLITMVKKALWFAPVVACLISLVSYILFKVGLQVILPAGIIGF